MLFGLLCFSGFFSYAIATTNPRGAGEHLALATEHKQSPKNYHSIDAPRVTRCAQLCSFLESRFSQQISYPHSAAYSEGQKYWSLQQVDTIPTCRFKPTCSKDVGEAIIAIKKTQCPFAIKSGGHGAFRGASNIPGGITIDLAGLNQIELDTDKRITRTGTGNRWEDVYAKLDPMGVAVIGGRNGEIGVGGLTLGGGISYFSGFRGWACDNVENYEVVLANGTIVNASPTSHPNLYFALRGGGNNFGLVTRMDLTTVPQGDMWGGQTVYPMSANASIIKALYWFNVNAVQDPKAHTFIAAACLHNSECVFTTGYEYAEPVVSPAVFQNFTKVKNTTSTMRITSLSNLAAELKATQPSGFYQSWWTLTVQNDYQLLYDILNDIWWPAVKPLINSTDSFLGTIAYQPLTEGIIANFGKNGGNAFGVNGSQGPLIVMGMDFQWSHPEDEQRVLATQEHIISASRELARSRNLGHPFLYQNYAYGTQDVFGGYGEASLKRLREVQEAYDPEGVFTNLQPGYFKLKPKRMGPE